MQHTGILRNWNDDRGFGFIAPTQGGAEVFVHIGAFPRDGSRPVVGERLGYELAPGRDGKPQAVNVTRLAIGKADRCRPTVATDGRPRGSWLGTIAVVMLLCVLGAWAYRHVSVKMNREALATQPAMLPVEAPAQAAGPAPRVAPAEAPVTATFNCDGRTHCSQMTSCAEAKWFINHCPGTKMDSDGDGVPCEEQWCSVGR